MLKIKKSEVWQCAWTHFLHFLDIKVDSTSDIYCHFEILTLAGFL